MKTCLKYFAVALTVLFAGCTKYGPRAAEDIEGAGRHGLFIVCEGNYTYGNASLCYYDTDTRRVENEVFVRRNGFPLGDVAQSMTVYGGRAYIAVNNSSVVFVVDPATFEYAGKITNLVSPRYVHVVNDEKAYISDMYSPSITVFDPHTLETTGSVPTDLGGLRKHPSTEQMVEWGGYVFTNCWSYDNRLLVIDAAKDEVVESIETGIQPNSIVLDRNGMIWVLSDGGGEDNPKGREAPSLRGIDAATRTVKRIFEFREGERAAGIAIDGEGRTLYILKDHIWKMNVDAEVFPDEPFIRNTTKNYWYRIGVDPRTSEIYLADAVDKVQPGTVYRYSPTGVQVDKFRVGVIPGNFCFYNRDDE